MMTFHFQLKNKQITEKWNLFSWKWKQNYNHAVNVNGHLETPTQACKYEYYASILNNRLLGEILICIWEGSKSHNKNAQKGII